MPWTPAERNFDRIQHEDLRRVVDPKFNALHDALSDAYYNFWRQGQSKPFQGYDVQATKEESKALFDKLHALIFHYYEVVFHAENLKQPKPKRIPESEYNDILDDSEAKVDTKGAAAQRAIDALDAEGIAIVVP